MPRQITAPQQTPPIGQRVRSLRETLKIPRTAFASMLGTGNQLLEAKEAGRCGFQPGELDRVRETARAHLASGVEAFRATFGEAALPFLSAATRHHHPAMKLDTPLTDTQRTEIAEARAGLLSLKKALTFWEERSQTLLADEAALLAEIAALRASGSASAQTAQSIATAHGRLELLSPQIKEAQANHRHNLAAGPNILRNTSEMIDPLLTPLYQRLAQDLAQAVAPFYHEPANWAGALVKDTDAARALCSLKTRGRHVAADAESIVWGADAMLPTLDALLAGEEIFTFTPTAAAR